MAKIESVDKPKNQHSKKIKKTDMQTRFFVFVDYVFLIVFFCFLGYILLNLFTV